MIAVCGGSFNPPTKAHIQMINIVSNLEYVEKVIILPVGDKYMKDGLVPVEHRINMLNEVFNDNSKVIISDLEATSDKQLKTIESLRLVSNEYNESKIAFVMGADNLLDIKKWYEYESILSEFSFIVFDRDNLDVFNIIDEDNALNKYRPNFHIEQLNIENGISSTNVRDLIKQNKPCFKYLNYSVCEYIKKNNLYKSKN